MSELPNRVVLVTGAGGGLGQALGQKFSQTGWRLAAGFHRLPSGATDEASLHLELDVRDADSITAAVEETLTKWGRIDALINNAGIIDDAGVWETTDEMWDRVMEVNLKGAFLCAREVSRTMIKQRDGHIINVSSFSGRVGQRGQSNYSAAKAGLFGLTASLARELGSRNVRVNAVLPGVLPTRMTAGLPDSELKQFAAANALGRINSLEEVAAFIVFLAGTQSISGQLFQLDSRIGSWT
jgi:3-oxoacyl-[acyl-carrier protein] reductase